MGRLVFTLLAAFFLGTAARAEIDPEAEAQLEAWAASFGALKSAQGDYVQEKQLRALKRPLKSEGKFWWSEELGFRWQSGEPPVLVTLYRKGEEVLLIRPKKKEAVRSSPDQALEKVQSEGLGLGAFLGGSEADWKAELKLLSCRSRSDGLLLAEFDFIDRQVSLKLRKLSMLVDPSGNWLREFTVFFRDQSSVSIRFTQMQRNPVLEPALFHYELGGYEVKGSH